MYSAIITVYDKATNYESTRCIIFYDNLSKVEVKSGKRTIVHQSSISTNHTWISVNDKILQVTWLDRFINKRHKEQSWLSKVEGLDHVKDEYDDHFGKRTKDAIPNAHGKYLQV